VTQYSRQLVANLSIGIAIVDREHASGPRKKQVVVGDVHYEIRVVILSDGMYRASWSCSACGEDGPWAPLSADPEQAMTSAMVGIEVHHSFVHGVRPPMTTRPNYQSRRRLHTDEPAVDERRTDET
jgi:hypothetical protein